MEYINFDFDICKEVLKIVSKAGVQYLNGDKTPAEIRAACLSGLDYNQKIFQKHPEYILEAKKLGLVTNAWTVNDPVIMDSLIDNGIDLITTNEPEMLIEKLKVKNSIGLDEFQNKRSSIAGKDHSYNRISDQQNQKNNPRKITWRRKAA